jgi:hypothetical protein
MLLFLGASLCLCHGLAGQNTMNPVQYTIANPAPGFEGHSYPFTGEYFEVESPTLKMQYAEVFW